MPERGCGTRKEGGLYLTVPMSPDGQPVEYFLIDPAIKWNGGTLRGPEAFSLPNEAVKHIIMGVGATYYPFVPDFVEEVRIMGLSKRVPRNIELDGLVPGQSRVLLMHPKAIVESSYETFVAGRRYPRGTEFDPRCPKKNPKSHTCVGDLWPLSAQPEFSCDKHIVWMNLVSPNDAVVSTPSVKYEVNERQVEMLPPVEFQAGLFMRFPTFEFQFVSKSGKVPRQVAEKFETSSFDLEVVQE